MTGYLSRRIGRGFLSHQTARAEALLALVQRLGAYWLILNEPRGAMLA